MTSTLDLLAEEVQSADRIADNEAAYVELIRTISEDLRFHEARSRRHRHFQVDW